MKKFLYILVFTFFCILCSSASFGQNLNEGSSFCFSCNNQLPTVYIPPRTPPPPPSSPPCYSCACDPSLCIVQIAPPVPCYSCQCNPSLCLGGGPTGGGGNPPNDNPPDTCELICVGEYLALNQELCQCDKLPRPWHYDGDGDEWHDGILGIRTQIESPGTGWRKTTKGVDCDDKKNLVTSNCYKDYFIDNDGDGYDAGIISAKEQGQYKTTTLGSDCDDSNASVYKNNKCGKCEVEPVSGVCVDLPCDKKISKKHLIEKANEYGIAKEAIMAIYNVETQGSAFRKNGDPKVLFERHRFSILTNGQYDSSHPDISNPIKGGYGTENSQLSRLKEAYDLDPIAATKSASYGGFQIMGFNYNLVGYTDITMFYNDMTSTNVDLHLNAFCEYAKNKGLITAINNKNWDAVAKGYNGKAYNAKDSYSKGYDKKIEKEYNKYINNPNLINNNDCL